MITVACPKCGEILSFEAKDVDSQYMDGITWKQNIELHCNKCGADLKGEWYWRVPSDEIAWEIA